MIWNNSTNLKINTFIRLSSVRNLTLNDELFESKTMSTTSLTNVSTHLHTEFSNVFFIPYHRKYSQSKYRKAVVYSTLLFDYCAIYHIRAKERAKYAALLHSRTGYKYGLKAERQNGRTKFYFISGIINPYSMVYHIIRAENLLIAGVFTTQVAKYQRVLHVKPSNKVHI